MPEPYEFHTLPPFLVHAIDELPFPEHRAIMIRLGFFDGGIPTYRNVAQQLQCSDLEARRLQKRALSRLSDRIPHEALERLRLSLGRWSGSEPVSSPLPAA